MITSYATIYTLAKELDVAAAIPQHMKIRLKEIFPKISIPSYRLRECSYTDFVHLNYKQINSSSFPSGKNVLVTDTVDYEMMKPYFRSRFERELEMDGSLINRGKKIIQVLSSCLHLKLCTFKLFHSRMH